jgi:hypothetical protein
VIEQMARRVARVFENDVGDERGWHEELIRRLSIRIEGVRPPLFVDEVRQPLQELRAFRHVFVHAYDLTVDPEKLGLILKYAHVVREQIPGLVSAFVAAVAGEQGLERPR